MATPIDNLNDTDEKLNSRAWLALTGISPDWRNDLIVLLRSESPIGWLVRDRLADLLEGKLDNSIEMKGHGATSKRVESLRIRQRWFSDGRIVARHVLNHSRVEDAWPASAIEISRDEDYCRKCYYYFKAGDEWIAAARHTDGKYYSNSTHSQLENVWHLTALDQHKRPFQGGKPLSAADYDAKRNYRLGYFSGIFSARSQSSEAAEAFAMFCELLPPSE